MWFHSWNPSTAADRFSRLNQGQANTSVESSAQIKMLRKGLLKKVLFEKVLSGGLVTEWSMRVNGANVITFFLGGATGSSESGDIDIPWAADDLVNLRHSGGTGGLPRGE